MTAQNLQPVKNVLALVIDGVDDAVVIAESGKPVIQEVGVLTNLFPDLLAAISTAGQIPSSLTGFSEADAAELVAYVGTKLVVGNPHAQDVIDKALKAAAAVYDLILAVKTPATTPEAAPAVS